MLPLASQNYILWHYICICIYIYISLYLSLFLSYMCVCALHYRNAAHNYGAIRSKKDTDTPLEKRCVVHIGSQSWGCSFAGDIEFLKRAQNFNRIISCKRHTIFAQMHRIMWTHNYWNTAYFDALIWRNNVFSEGTQLLKKTAVWDYSVPLVGGTFWCKHYLFLKNMALLEQALFFEKWTCNEYCTCSWTCTLCERDPFSSKW